MNAKDDAVKKTKKKRKNPFRYFFMDFVKVTAAIPVWVCLRPKVIYENKAARKKSRGPVVVVSNHVGFLDPIAVYSALWYRRVHIIATEELFATRIGNWFFTNINCIKVDRGNFNMDTFRKSMDVLESGKALALFPEGGINREDNVTPVKAFKSGAVMMSLKGKAPIVNMYISKPEHWYNRYVIVMGEPIDPQKLCEGTPSLRAMDQISEELRKKELKLMETYQQRKTKKSSK